MNIIESIKKRRSVRTYTGEPLSSEHIAQIKQYISQLKAPFGVNARIELINVNSDGQPVKLGTYGVIKDVSAYIALIYEEAPFAETAAAYMFEQAILFCTDLGLGTCWLGGTFSNSDFKKQIKLKENETLRIVSPVGYASDRKSIIDKLFRADKKHISRKPFGELFFDKNFDTPLTEDRAGAFSTPLQMVRLAPSASNKQEWRVLFEDKTLHFYKQPYISFDNIDIGIALCHFELTCKELGIDGKFEILKDFPHIDNIKYVISWIQQE